MKPEKITFHIQNETGRVDKVIAELFEKYTRTQIQSWIKKGNILINNKPVKVNYKVTSGDYVVLEEPPEEPLKMEPENIPLDIVFEDESILVVNKPWGMVVHPSKGHLRGTLVNALLFHVNELSEGTAYVRPGIVHRIDKDTSWLLVIAKNNTAHQKLADQFHAHTIERQYIALVHGKVQHEEGTINAPIGRMQNNRLKRTVTKDGKPAITHFKRIKEFQKFTLLNLRLETGRTHQIRVHMLYIGHPLLGDPMYGPFETVHEKGQFLHAATLGFNHPVTNEWMEFQAPLPDYFEKKIHELAK